MTDTIDQTAQLTTSQLAEVFNDAAELILVGYSDFARDAINITAGGSVRDADHPQALAAFADYILTRSRLTHLTATHTVGDAIDLWQDKPLHPRTSDELAEALRAAAEHYRLGGAR